MPNLARASISAGRTSLIFPVNPYTANWGYQENAVSTDTLGGRVVQLLSVAVTDLQITSVAGSRKELQKVADSAREIMEYHISSMKPATLLVPSRRWNFKVYLTAMPQMGWDVSATTYPYQLQLAIDEDISGVKTKQVFGAALSRLFEGIGYNPAVHGGDVKGFQKIVDTVLGATGGPGGGGGTGGGGDAPGGGGGAGTDSRWGGSNLWQPDIANAPWNGKTIKDQIENCWASTFGSKSGSDATCIAERESGFFPRAHNSYSSSGIHHVYGLFQISDVHKASSWWPKSGVNGTEGGLLYDPEYNTRCAMTIYKQQGWTPWSTAGGCGL